jgi:transposase-like protein
MSQKVTKNDEIQAEDTRFPLTATQLKAVELLLEGKTITETARQLDIRRETVSSWYNRHPGFIATYNQAQRSTWEAGQNKLLDSRMKAIDKLMTLVESDNEAVAFKAAMALLGLQVAPSGRTDPDSIANDQVLRQMTQEILYNRPLRNVAEGKGRNQIE